MDVICDGFGRFRRWRWMSVFLCLSLMACAGHAPRITHRIDLEAVRFDSPDKAAEWRVARRLPPHLSEMPVERLMAARAQMREMPQFASATGERFQNEEALRQRYSQHNLDGTSAAINAWDALGPGNIGGRTRALAINPNNAQIMYAGAAGGGVWKTTNGGAHWQHVGDDLGSLAVVALRLDPTNPNVIYAGTGEGTLNQDALRGAGVFKSIDAGSSWQQLSATANANFHFVHDIAMAPNNSQWVVVATRQGLFTSQDGGNSFSQTHESYSCTDLDVDVFNAQTVWLASCGNFTPTTVVRSVDAMHWTTVLGEATEDLAGMGRTAVAIKGGRAYAIASSRVRGYDRDGDGTGDYPRQLHAFFRSDDGGQTWTATLRNTDAHHGNTMILSGYFDCNGLQLGIGQSWYNLTIAIDPVDTNRVWVGGIHLFRSDDGGFNWGRADKSASEDQLHPDHHALVFHPQFDGINNVQLFNGQDGGVYRVDNARAATVPLPAQPFTACSNQGNAQWTSLNNNYAASQFYHGSVFPDGRRYYGGTQDTSNVVGNDLDGINQWDTWDCGDGGYTAINPLNTNVLYTSCQGVSIGKSTDGGVQIFDATNGIDASEGSSFIAPYAMDPNNPQVLWFGGTRAWRTVDAADSWQAASSRFITVENVGTFLGYVSAIAIAPNNSNRVLMATSNDTAIHHTSSALSSDGNITWSRATVNSSQYFDWTITAIAFSLHQPNVVFATGGWYDRPHLLKSTDGGATWNVVPNNASLPDIPALSIVMHPDDANRIYVGTELGVFVSTDAGASFAVEVSDFPNAAVESMQIVGRGAQAKLFAFTHGRGAFRLPVPVIADAMFADGFE